ncbi:hypothetical protein CN918_28495 [Priestia megaterium]|nr:hypothetical protein CN918_28495 [Priestia megaterium]
MDRLLYFPYITIPQTPWLYKSLLYWDTIDTITPEGYLRSNDGLFEAKHMNSLVESKLVRGINPAQYVYSIPRFTNDFLKYVDDTYMGKSEAHMASSLDLETGARIHLQKMNSIGDELVRRGLAIEDGMWYCMRPAVANDYMFYLASLLGAEINSQPITDKVTNFSASASFGTQVQMNMLKREESRKNVLESAFPIPLGMNDIEELSDFKKQNGDQLKQFRTYIEDKLLNIDAAPPYLQEEMLQNLKLNIKEEKESISCKMKEKWNVIDEGTLITVGADAIPLVQGIRSGSMVEIAASALPLVSLVTEKLLEVRSNHYQALNSPLAYAFLVEKKFSNI